jgi:predicted transcriptional regulator
MLAKKRKKIQKGEKTPRQLERHLKGVAFHRRIEILFVIFENNGITLDSICEIVNGNTKTISEHTRKLVQSGLVNKTNRGREVGHSLSPYGMRFLKFLKSF